MIVDEIIVMVEEVMMSNSYEILLELMMVMLLMVSYKVLGGDDGD